VLGERSELAGDLPRGGGAPAGVGGRRGELGGQERLRRGAEGGGQPALRLEALAAVAEPVRRQLDSADRVGPQPLELPEVRQCLVPRHPAGVGVIGLLRPREPLDRPHGGHRGMLGVQLPLGILGSLEHLVGQQPRPEPLGQPSPPAGTGRLAAVVQHLVVEDERDGVDVGDVRLDHAAPGHRCGLKPGQLLGDEVHRRLALLRVGSGGRTQVRHHPRRRRRPLDRRKAGVGLVPPQDLPAPLTLDLLVHHDVHEGGHHEVHLLDVAVVRQAALVGAGDGEVVVPVLRDLVGPDVVKGVVDRRRPRDARPRADTDGGYHEAHCDAGEARRVHAAPLTGRRIGR
jgi:hypothetical protein